MKQNYLKGKLRATSHSRIYLLGLLSFLVCLLSTGPAAAQTVSGGSLVVQMESTGVPANWKRATTSGVTYHEATVDNFQNPESGGKHSFSITFNQTGVYRVNWLSKINIGNEDSEHNDNWLKFPNTSDIVFFGAKGNTSTEAALISSQNSNTNVVYPKGSSRVTASTTPEGAGKDGWFKVFMNTKNVWVWEAKTSDHDGHQLYVRVLNTGTYTMQVSNRSRGHAIDKIGIWKVDTHGDDGGSITGGSGGGGGGDDGGGDDGGGDDGGGGGGGTTGDATFVLVNTNTQNDIMTLTNNSVIDLETAGSNIGIRVDIDGTTSSGPTLTLTGPFDHTQTEGKNAPFSLFGDIGDNINPWPSGSLLTGDYTLSAKFGSTTTTISFEIVDDGSGGSGGGGGGGGSSGDVTLYLVNTNTQSDIMTLTDNSVIDLETAGNAIGIRADIAGTVNSGPVFTLTGAYSHTQSEGKFAPYSLFGDIGTTINPWPSGNLNLGNYTLSVKVGGSTTTISFEIVDDGSGGSGGGITFHVVNTNTQNDIMTLSNNSVINLSTTGTAIGIRTTIPGPLSSGPVFTLSGAYSHSQSEGKFAPYSLFGDIGVNINPWPSGNLNSGSYTLSVKVSGSTTTISFSIINGTTANARDISPDFPSLSLSLPQITSVYPNPVADERLNVSFSQPIDGEVSFTVFDPTGKAVQTEEIKANNTVLLKLRLTEAVSPGLYYLKMKSREHQVVWHQRFIKTH